MSSDMTRARRLKIALALLVPSLAATVAGVFLIRGLQDKITTRLARGWVLTPLELYSRGIPLSPGRRFPREEVERELATRARQPERDYVFGEGPTCTARAGITAEVPADHQCLWLREPALAVTWTAEGWIQNLWVDGQPRDFAPLFPRLVTQFFEGHPIQQQNVTLGEIPLACLQAVTAIEDRDFLDHRGISATGTLRAMLRNVRRGRFAEGGSTITQQLVKNFFLTSKKTIRRKIEEQALAVLLEAQISKDQILEMYLNVIYMGQNGPYQVRGFGSAARAYFDRPAADLNLDQCALLAALINSPGRFSPFDHPEAARSRRGLVLDKMLAAGMIAAGERDDAAARALPERPAATSRVHAPYFVMSALREFQNWDLETDAGARLYTALDPAAQAALVLAVDRVLPGVEKRVRKPSRQPLQVAALTVDVRRAEVIALTGGRDFHASPYNRATDARRQIGSLVKPFVYWPAVTHAGPLTEALDEPFEWTVGRNKWKPRNYEKTSIGPVPYFFALAESLNVPTARVGQLVGLDAVADTLSRAGVRAEVPRLPSLTLGAFELSLAEVAQGYVSLARLGAGEFVRTLDRVESLGGEVLFERQPTTDLRLEPVPTAVVNGMLRQTVEFGTARSIRALGLDAEFAGKTGTTSDTKDAWFIGFDGRLLTAVWVGYDDNTPMGLTGATAALPIWAAITRDLAQIYRPQPLPIPDGAEDRAVTRDEILAKFPRLTRLPDQMRLTFDKAAPR